MITPSGVNWGQSKSRYRADVIGVKISSRLRANGDR
jgi:hypothetical protein